MELNEIKHKLKKCNGSEGLFHGLLKTCCYTDGFKLYMELAKSYWLYDIVQTEFFNVIKLKKPDIYYLRVNVEALECTITLEDYKEDILYQRNVNFSTHPDGQIDFHFGWDGERGIICLPNEN